MEWNEETISRLRSLWQEGHSTAEIGRRMSITKNAVVGKAHRLTLPPRPSPIRKGLTVAPGTSPAGKTADGIRHAMAARNALRTVAARPDPARPSGETATSQRPVPAPVQAINQAPRGHHTPDAPPRPVSPSPAADSLGHSNVTPMRRRVVDTAGSGRPSGGIEEQGHQAGLGRSEVGRRRLACCWPLGDPGTKQFRFCGGDPIPGKPYCTEHAQLAYVKLRDRRDTA